MGLGDFLEKSGQVLMTFKADTSDLKAKMKELKGDQKELAKTLLDTAEANNNSLKKWADGLTTVKIGFEFAKAAVEGIGASWKTYEKAALAAGGAEAERAKQFRGSLSEWNRGLEHVQVAIGKLIVQMGPLLGAIGKAVALIADAVGYAADLLDQTKRTTEIEGKKYRVSSTGALVNEEFAKQYDTEKQVDIFRSGAIEQAVNRIRIQAETYGQKSVNAIVDAWGAGMFRQAANLDLDAMKDAGQKASFAIVNAFSGGFAGSAKQWYDAGGDLRDKNKKVGASKPGFEIGGIDVVEGIQKQIGVYLDTTEALLAQAQAIRDAAVADAQRAQQGATGSLGAGFGATGAEQSFLNAESFASDQNLAALQLYRDHMLEIGASIGGVGEQMRGLVAEFQGAWLEDVFGESNTFSEFFSLQDSLKMGFETLASAATAGFDAWVESANAASGQAISAGKAAQYAVGSMLKALGKQLTVEALKETAYGIASLARHDYSSAGTHFASAAAFGTAALAAGYGARSLGTQAPSSSSSNSGAPRVGGDRGGNPDRNETITIYMGDTLSDSNSRTQRNKVARAVAGAHRELERTRGVEFR